MIYLDYAATTPMSEKAAEVYTHVATKLFGNASSLHDFGGTAKQIKEASAKAIGETIGAQGKDIHFTSGATEANFLAIKALLDGNNRKNGHLITTSIEHASIKDAFEKLETQGFEVSWIGVDASGHVQLDELKKVVRKDTVLVSIQHINSEIGTIQPIEDIGVFLKQNGILFHTDAVQSFGKISLNVQELNVDALSISAHKIYGPKGIGAVWINPGIEWKPFFDDIHQAKKLKSGTDNISGMAAFATAAKEIMGRKDQEYSRMQTFNTSFKSSLEKLSNVAVIEGNSGKRSPYILGLRFPGLEGQFFMLECNQAGLAISTGSACQVGSEQPNRTMKALGRTDEEAREFVRFSFGKFVKEDHLNEIIPKIDTILKRHFNKVNRTV